MQHMPVTRRLHLNMLLWRPGKPRRLNAHRESASHYNTALQHSAALAPEETCQRCLKAVRMSATSRIKLKMRSRVVAVLSKSGKNSTTDESKEITCGGCHDSRGSSVERPKPKAVAVEAVTILEDLAPGPELAMAYSNRSQLHMLADESQDAIIWGSRAIELAEKHRGD
jgi:hypothetical protein